jgi:hypothetical protein
VILSELPLVKQQAVAATNSLPAGRPEAVITTGLESIVNKQRLAVAAEVKDVSGVQAKPEIVWRKSLSSTPLREAALSQQSGDSSSSTRHESGSTRERVSQPTGRTETTTKGQSQNVEIGIKQISPQVIHTISEKVMRAISLELAVELERRGLKKWR